MIELGIDLLNPIQWRCPGMDREGLKKDFGGRIILHGGVDNQHTLPFGTIKEVRREVLDNLRACLADPELAHFHFKVHDISSYKIHDPAEQDRRFAALEALFPKTERMTIHRRVFHNATGHLPIAEEKRAASRTYHLCPYPWFSFMIASNGDVVACCRDLEHKTVLGNLFQQEFDEIWNGEKYRALRRDLVDRQPDKQAACVGCDMPYDTEKFTLGHLAKTAVHRMLILDKSK
jgi:radical SAM protein with 4Fe4S-binding SPASM domain